MLWRWQIKYSFTILERNRRDLYFIHFCIRGTPAPLIFFLKMLHCDKTRLQEALIWDLAEGTKRVANLWARKDNFLINSNLLRTILKHFQQTWSRSRMTVMDKSEPYQSIYSVINYPWQYLFMSYFNLCPNDWDLSHIYLFIIVP